MFNLGYCSFIDLYNYLSLVTLLIACARVVKLVDTLDLGSSASRHGGSSPSTRTFSTKSTPK